MTLGTLIRRLVVLALCCTAALALSGCFVITDENVSQPGGWGDVLVHTETCNSFFSPSSPDCNSSNTNTPSGPMLLLAYRLQDGVVAPDTIKTTDGTVTFQKDQSYTDSLTSNSNSAPPSGEHWVGYSAMTNGSYPGGTLEPLFGLPQGDDGTPFHGPFNYRTVTGYSDGDPVQCAADPTTDNSGTVCIDSPSSSDYPNDNHFASRDVGIHGPPDVIHVRAGESTTMPFAVELGGPGPVGVSLSASTSAHGVHPSSPDHTTFDSADSSNPVSVAVNTDPDAQLGTFDVTLTATSSNGKAVRTRNAKLVVDLGLPAATALPEITGTAVVGKTLTCSTGDWTGSPTNFAYQWTREGKPIDGATKSSYTLTQDDGELFIGCTVTATNAVGTGQASSKNIRAAQAGGADVDLHGHVGVSKDGSLYLVLPGVTVSCPPRLTQNCGFSTTISTSDSGSSAAAHLSRTVTVAHGGFFVESGKKITLKMHLTHFGSRLLRKRGLIKLSAEIVTRNHSLERIHSRKHFTIHRPR